MSFQALALDAPNSIVNKYKDSLTSFNNYNVGYIRLPNSKLSTSNGSADSQINYSSSTPQSSNELLFNIGGYNITIGDSFSNYNNSYSSQNNNFSTFTPYVVYSPSSQSIGVMTNNISIKLPPGKVGNLLASYSLKLITYSESLGIGFFTYSGDPADVINELNSIDYISFAEIEIIENEAVAN